MIKDVHQQLIELATLNKTFSDTKFNIELLTNSNTGNHFIKVNDSITELSINEYQLLSEHLPENVLPNKKESKDIYISVTSKILDQQLNHLLNKLNVTSSDKGLSKRVWVSLPKNIRAGRTSNYLIDNLKEQNIKTSILEFLGFSRIDNKPIFKVYRSFSDEPNEQNTFSSKETINEAFIIKSTHDYYTTGVIGNLSEDTKIHLVSCLEDHFTGWELNKQTDPQSFWLDFTHLLKDDNNIIFKINANNSSKLLSEIIENHLINYNIQVLKGQINKRLWIALPKNYLSKRAAGSITDNLTEPENKTGILEFLGYSKVDSLPIFKAYTNKTIIGGCTFYNETIQSAFSVFLHAPEKEIEPLLIT